MMEEWKKYVRTNTAEMRDLYANESKESLVANGVSISVEDAKLDNETFLKGKIARNPKNHKDQWYINPNYAEDNFALKDNVVHSSKTLRNSNVSGAHKNVSDLQVVGNGDSFRLLFKAFSENEGWMKSTKALEIEGLGCLVQVTTQQRNPDGSYAVAEALTFIPNVTILDDENDGRRLVSTFTTAKTF